MVEHPRWADMCARILHQCEFLRGGKENLARFLEVPETDLEQWLSARGGPPRAESHCSRSLSGTSRKRARFSRPPRRNSH
jgi:hypothetical protein